MTLFLLIALCCLGWFAAGVLVIVGFVALRALADKVNSERTQGRVAQTEVEFYREHIARFAGNSLPRMGLPFSHKDSDGDGIRIDYAPDSDEAIVVSAQWHDGACTASAALESWDVRLKVAGAILAGVPRTRIDEALQDVEQT